MRQVFRTVSFWACVVMAGINLVIFFIAKHLHSMPLMKLALASMAVCAVGATAHWALDRALGKSEKPRR